MVPVFAFVVTVVVGFLGAGIFGSWLNWPDAGAVFAVAAMGSLILWVLQERWRDQDERDRRDQGDGE